MTRLRGSVLLVVGLIVGIPDPAPVSAQGASDVAGRWTLKRELSQFPAEIGFGADWLAAGKSIPDSPSGGGSGSGGRGRRGSGGGASGGGAGAFPILRQSQDDAKRVRQLTDEVREPPAHLTIVEAAGAVTITNDRGQARTFHPDGREEVLQLDGVSVDVTAKREAGGLTVLYRVEQGRDLRYTYARTASPAQLVVDVQFLERGGGDKVRRVYEPTSETETLAPAGTASGGAVSGATSGATSGTASGTASAAGAAAGSSGAGSFQGQPINQQPDAELKGLTRLGIVVEELGQQATACGLSQGGIEAAVSKRLSDAGFKVLRNSDEDTYVYINVISASLSSGLCVSRYDLFLYTHAASKLSYQQAPVLVQVSLLHKGGIAGGPSAAHAGDVLRGLQEYVDQFATRIRDANASK
jgi:hypothetical protein